MAPLQQGSRSMSRINKVAILTLIVVLNFGVASASMLTKGVGSGSSGGGTFTPSFLLIQTGSIMLIQTGSKLEIHS